IHLLTEEGLVSNSVLNAALAESKTTKQPLFALLSEKHIIDDEMLTHAIAQVSGVPYVNLMNTLVNQQVLELLTEDVAERFMAIPPADVHIRLAGVMVDASNVQAVDYPSNLIGNPLKIFISTEVRVRHILDQYRTDLSTVNEAAQVSK